MNISYGNGPTQYGPGVSIEMTGEDVALAISAYLVAHGIHISGATPMADKVIGFLGVKIAVRADMPANAMVLVSRGQEPVFSFAQKPSEDELRQAYGVAATVAVDMAARKSQS